MSKTAEVTVIIPNYNGREMLENCIKTLEKQTCRDFKLLVVDNGSTDGSADIHPLGLAFELIALSENTGFCGAVNTGIRRTDTPYFILLNNDTEADPRFVEELLLAIKKSPRLFSCGAQMLDYRRRDLLDNAGDLYTVLGWAVARGKGKPAASFADPQNVFSCCGGAAIYRTDAAKQLGLFDEAHFAYLEDVDLGYRAKIMGYQNRYIPSAKVFHIGSATTGTRYNEKKVFLAARNTVFVLYKNMPFLQLLFNLPLILAGSLVKWLFFCKKGFGVDYRRGIFCGLREAGRLRRVRAGIAKSGNYLRIELELFWNIFRIILSL